MKIRKGQAMVKLPEFTEVGTTALMIWSNGHPRTHPDGYWEVIAAIDHNVMLNAGSPGDRTVYSIIRDHKKQRDILWINPKPARTMHAVFSYCPTRRRI